MDGETLFAAVGQELNQGRMVEHVERMNQWHRYTGTPQGEAFVDDLIARLGAAGIPYSIETYEAYASLPVRAALQVEGEQVRLLADVYSGQAKDLTAQMVYDAWSEKPHITENENLRRFAAFRGKIVLSHAGGGKFADEVKRAGGLAVVHINESPGGYIHHDNISAVWGTPGRSDLAILDPLPSAGISLEDGTALARRIQDQDVTAVLNVETDTQVRVSRMPVVDIPGRTESFVLLNGHYDSWYEGITDNAGSDAILLELARAFWKHRDKLLRGVRIAWWSGHSDARYAGSAWYCDHHLKELTDRCVASINLDLTGCKNAKQIRARTACTEGEALTAGLIETYTGRKAKPFIPMIRGADQSFWGARIPIHVMFKYEPLDEERVSPCPSGGPWWHTAEDTLDKLDPDILLRDARLNGHLCCLVANAPALPVKPAAFARWMGEELKGLRLAPEFDAAPVVEAVEALGEVCQAFETAVEKTADASADAVLKRTVGEMARLVYTSSDRYHQMPSLSYGPFGVLRSAQGMERENAPARLFLFQRTDFQREVNRLCGQLEEVRQVMEDYLKT